MPLVVRMYIWLLPRPSSICHLSWRAKRQTQIPCRPKMQSTVWSSWSTKAQELSMHSTCIFIRSMMVRVRWDIKLETISEIVRPFSVTFINYLPNWKGEHNAVRFKDGIPESVWYSQHEYGEAITYIAANKIGKRPVAFSARGSHANYLVGGDHDLAKERTFPFSLPEPHMLTSHRPSDTNTHRIRSNITRFSLGSNFIRILLYVLYWYT